MTASGGGREKSLIGRNLEIMANRDAGGSENEKLCIGWGLQR